MKKISFLLLLVLSSLAIFSCQEDDIEIASMVLSAPNESDITGELQGDDYVWTWPAQNDLDMQVEIYIDGVKNSSQTVSGNSYTHTSVQTNIAYKYVFKFTDGTNYSSGTVKSYTREGATQITGISLSQVEKVGGYDLYIEWNAASDATSINLTATNGTRTVSESLASDQTSYTVSDVDVDQTWTVTLVAVNSTGTSLSTSSSIKVGKTAIAFLSEYPTVDDLLANGDDDEICAWLWAETEYPTITYLYFGDITSVDSVEPYRVLFWLRDVETDGADLWQMPQVAEDAVPYIQQWYKDGGSILLWGHAIPYLTNLGRLDASLLKMSYTFGTGAGGYNADTWSMAVQLYPSSFKKDFSSHAIYKGLEVTTTSDTKLITFKGPGWTEDHNCLFFDVPVNLTGLGNQTEECYNVLTSTYGLYPLGVWDSQIWWVSQMNVWELQQGNTDFTGTILCIGNGGCEFSMKNDDGTPDISNYPSNNIYQDNVLTLAKNSLEYLKTR